MKALMILPALSLFLTAMPAAAQSAKPLVSLSVKRQLTTTDRDKLGPRSDARSKTFTLRVTVTNTSSSTLAGLTLSGTALLERETEGQTRITRGNLAAVKVPALKPNARTTIDLGSITLDKVEWRGREMEEKLEEWQVICKQGHIVVGEDITRDFQSLDKQRASQKPEDGRPGLQRKKKWRDLVR